MTSPTPTRRLELLLVSLLTVLVLSSVFVRRAAPVHAATDTLPPVASADPRDGAIPVLVELFTSEGCSSCPTADAVLAHLQLHQPVSGAEIIVLEEHVDYWDELGWHDRFSSHQFTDRQTAYSLRLRLTTDYTPQMIVDGTDQFVGNDIARALHAVAQAAHQPKLALTLSPLVFDAGHISATVSAAAAAPLPKADLYAVLVDAAVSTSVLKGENSGRSLHHVSVARGMTRIGSLDSLTRKPLSFTLPLPPDSDAPGTRIIVFAQRPGQGAIIAATSMSPTEAPQPPSSSVAGR